MIGATRVVMAGLSVLMAVLSLLGGSSALSAASPGSSYGTPGGGDRQYMSMLVGEDVDIPDAATTSAAIGLGHSIVDYLTDHPNDAGVSRVVDICLSTGNSAHDTAIMVYASVYSYQPRLLPVLEHWITSNDTPNITREVGSWVPALR